MRGHRQGRLQAGRADLLASTCAASEFFDKTASTPSRAKAQPSTTRRDGRLLRELVRASTRSSRSKTAWPKTTGTAGRRSPSGSASKSSSWATTCSSPTPSILEKGIQRGHRQLHPDQGEPDRHADRDPRRHRDGASAPATPRSSRTARARPRTPPSPTSRWRRTRARSRPARRRAPTASRSTTSCCASRTSWTRWRSSGVTTCSTTSASNRAVLNTAAQKGRIPGGCALFHFRFSPFAVPRLSAHRAAAGAETCRAGGLPLRRLSHEGILAPC